MFMPAPTDAKRKMSPLVIVCPSNFPRIIRLYKVGTVATKLFPSLSMIIGRTFSGTSSDQMHGKGV